MQRALIRLAVVQAVVEHESRVRCGRDGQVEPREGGLAAGLHIVQVDQKSEVAVAGLPGLARVVVVVVRLVKLPRVVAHRLQRLKF